ncbi:MAG: LemA family protein, partial [Patescibacteria group bacterium]
MVYIVVGVVAIWTIATYNGLVGRRNQTDEAWADIDVQLKRRYDLIPNLVETVKGYASHEREAFENVTKARAQALGAQSVHDKEVA